MSDYGTRLTARFFEACGREVDYSDPRPSWKGEGLGVLLGGDEIRASGHVPDYTQPGHLETVIGMVRETEPHAFLREIRYLWDLSKLLRKWNSLTSSEIATALMLAAIRAAGLEPPEEGDD